MNKKERYILCDLCVYTNIKISGEERERVGKMYLNEQFLTQGEA